MSQFIGSIIVSTLFYMQVLYMSYISSFILYHGFKYGLWSPLIKSTSFIVVCYISIIADVWLYVCCMYSVVFIKNGSLSLLAGASLLYARK